MRFDGKATHQHLRPLMSQSAVRWTHARPLCSDLLLPLHCPLHSLEGCLSLRQSFGLKGWVTMSKRRIVFGQQFIKWVL
jgi:hypothetical protein